ncbi:CU044_2847 family protein [Streptomyces sp. NPDC050095]|uniref:CU044_2847 family protein n=1 Tax=unclassified Streptomyces TaxID=2593676 RepID=UPI00343D9915
MDGLVEFEVSEGVPVLFDAADEDAELGGARLVSRENGAVRASSTFEQSLGAVRSAAESALRVLRDGALRPDGVEIEFGVKMSAEVGAVITKGTAEGHLVVKLSWSSASADSGAGS